jgi:hypothetical protein
VLEIQGDIWSVVEYYHPLPHTTFIGPPKNIQAQREGDQVTITWAPVTYTFPEDLKGYLIEARVCQGGARVPVAVHTDSTSMTLTDEAGCAGESSGKLYAVEKHGYTDPVPIPWP